MQVIQPIMVVKSVKLQHILQHLTTTFLGWSADLAKLSLGEDLSGLSVILTGWINGLTGWIDGLTGWSDILTDRIEMIWYFNWLVCCLDQLDCWFVGLIFLLTGLMIWLAETMNWIVFLMAGLMIWLMMMILSEKIVSKSLIMHKWILTCAVWWWFSYSPAFW